LEAVKKHQVPLLTGCSEFKIFDNANTAPSTARKYDNRWIQSYNSSTVLGDSSPEFYEKSKLVPFVERTPYFDYLKNLQNIIQIDLGGGFGNYGIPDSVFCLDGKTTSEIGNIICYESIFPHHVREIVQKGAKFITVITNDGWWGKSSGYIQHAYYARLRAIENRREVIRCANTGLSMHIDNKGNILKSTSWWKPEFFDTQVKHYKEKTFYVLWGDWLCILALIISLLGIFSKYKTKT
jgi:apolipoprotein N-acyltransferase